MPGSVPRRASCSSSSSHASAVRLARYPAAGRRRQSTPVRSCAVPGGRRGAGTWRTTPDRACARHGRRARWGLEGLQRLGHTGSSAPNLHDSRDIFGTHFRIPPCPDKTNPLLAGHSDGPSGNRTRNLGLKRPSTSAQAPKIRAARCSWRALGRPLRARCYPSCYPLICTDRTRDFS
jgi:hypothetical protein